VEQVESGPAAIGGGGFGPGRGGSLPCVVGVRAAKASAVVHTGDVCQSRDTQFVVVVALYRSR
jgi:hypothetical protein